MDKGTPIGKARGLGSAHGGAEHWKLQRFTALGNLMLGAWFVASVLMMPSLSYTNLTDWLGGLFPATAMILLIVTTIWHARLGLQVLVEDYVHEEGNKFAAIAVLNFLAAGGAVFGILCVLRVVVAAAGQQSMQDMIASLQGGGA